MPRDLSVPSEDGAVQDDEEVIAAQKELRDAEAAVSTARNKIANRHEVLAAAEESCKAIEQAYSAGAAAVAPTVANRSRLASCVAAIEEQIEAVLHELSRLDGTDAVAAIETANHKHDAKGDAKGEANGDSGSFTHGGGLKGALRQAATAGEQALAGTNAELRAVHKKELDEAPLAPNAQTRTFKHAQCRIAKCIAAACPVFKQTGHVH